MKTLKQLIQESSEDIKLDAMIGYGISYPVKSLLTQGTVEDLKKVIEKVPFTPEDIENAVNNSGLTYKNWKADIKVYKDSYIALRRKDSNKNLVSLEIRKK